MRSVSTLTALAAALLIGAGLLSWAGCSCKDSEEKGPVVVVPQQAPKPAPQPAAQPGKQKQKAAVGFLSAPAEYASAVFRARGYAEDSARKAWLENELKQFRALEGRFPKDLKELEKWRGEPLQSPGKGETYKYDPTTGTIEIVKSP